MVKNIEKINVKKRDKVKGKLKEEIDAKEIVVYERGGRSMKFHDACVFCFESFKMEYGSGIGRIQDCGDYWVFYRKSDEPEYGPLPMLVYKDNRKPEPMTFDLYLSMMEEVFAGKLVPVPARYSRS